MRSGIPLGPWFIQNSDREILKLYYDTNIFLIDYLDRQQKLTITLRRKIKTFLLSSEGELSQEQCKLNKRTISTYKYNF